LQHQLPEFDKMPESLVNTLQSCQTLRDVFHALHAHWTQQSSDQIHEYQIEVERLQTKLEHIRAQNNVVALSMEESKSNSEQLSLLIGENKMLSRSRLFERRAILEGNT
jgi:maltodextrin utilization protein YvdJ